MHTLIFHRHIISTCAAGRPKEHPTAQMTLFSRRDFMTAY